MIQIDPLRPVHEIVTDRLAAARVLDRFGIDYCCHGDQTLVESCERRGLDLDPVVNALTTLDADPTEPDYDQFSLGDLADEIVLTHHAYLRGELPALIEKVQKVVAAHGERDPRLVDVRRVLLGLRSELEQHMQKEEQILFPICHQLDGAEAVEFFCGSVRNPIAMMVEEHTEAGSALDHLKELTDGYQEPADSCATHRSLLWQLARLEEDLHRHIHKENYILFPKAIAREDASERG